MFQLFVLFLNVLFIYIYICVFFIIILFVLSVCRCLWELEAYDTKTNSLYVQAYLAIKALSDSDSYWWRGERGMKRISVWG